MPAYSISMGRFMVENIIQQYARLVGTGGRNSRHHEKNRYPPAIYPHEAPKPAGGPRFFDILPDMKKKQVGTSQKLRHLTYERKCLHDITLSVWRAVATVVGQEQRITREELFAKMPKATSHATVKALLENGLLVEEAGALKLSPQGEDFCRLTHERRLTRDVTIAPRMIH